jgi:hypothetical protein
MKKKILIYASDNRGSIEVKNVVSKLSQKDCDYIFVYPIDQEFTYESNIDYYKYPNFESKSIGFSLPFKPDIVLITRESWLPETNIVVEFKQVGAIVCNLENSSWLYNNVKTRLEILSRMKFPTNLIDVFFDHSTWTYQSKIEAGWIKGKSIITGIPKFDVLKDVTTEDIKQKYNLTKPVIILYGSMEDNIRPNIINISKELASFTGWDINNTYSRTEVTKFICNYVKSNKLFDQSEGADKSNILVDAKLKSLLKYDPANPPKDKDGKSLPLTYFRLQQYLKDHFSKPATEEVEVEVEDDTEEEELDE